jgi:hypothetical protein
MKILNYTTCHNFKPFKMDDANLILYLKIQFDLFN